MTNETSPASSAIPSSVPIQVAVGPRETGPDGRPLLLLLHGYGSHERDLPGIVEQLGSGWDWLSVRAPFTVEMGGAAWFQLSQGGELDRDRIAASLTGLLEFLDEHTTGQPIVPVGFSQGGLMVLELLRARPDTFNAGVVLSGFVDPLLRETDDVFKQSQPRVFAGRAKDDDTVVPLNAFAMTDEWLREYTDATIRHYAPLGHSISQEELADVKDFLDSLELSR